MSKQAVRYSLQLQRKKPVTSHLRLKRKKKTHRNERHYVQLMERTGRLDLLIFSNTFFFGVTQHQSQGFRLKHNHSPNLRTILYFKLLMHIPYVQSCNSHYQLIPTASTSLPICIQWHLIYCENFSSSNQELFLFSSHFCLYSRVISDVSLPFQFRSLSRWLPKSLFSNILSASLLTCVIIYLLRSNKNDLVFLTTIIF